MGEVRIQAVLVGHDTAALECSICGPLGLSLAGEADTLLLRHIRLEHTPQGAPPL